MGLFSVIAFQMENDRIITFPRDSVLYPYFNNHNNSRNNKVRENLHAELHLLKYIPLTVIFMFLNLILSTLSFQLPTVSASSFAVCLAVCLSVTPPHHLIRVNSKVVLYYSNYIHISETTTQFHIIFCHNSLPPPQFLLINI